MAYDPATGRWANSAYWEQPTAATRLAMCNALLTELTDAMVPRISGQNESWDPTLIGPLRDSVLRDRVLLQREVDAQAGVGIPTLTPTVTRDYGRFR